jgi:hypothetical protein
LPPLPSLSPLDANTTTSGGGGGGAGGNIAPSPTRTSPRTRLSRGTRRT